MIPETPNWWPPKVGAALRHSTHHGTGGAGVKRVDALLHVLAIFVDKDGEERIVTAEWFPTKRQWSYAVKCALDAAFGLIWPDGTEKPCMFP